MKDYKRGLVLEGGAMRGMFTAGVLDVLMENGIEFHGIVGVSAGAAFGCNYKSRQIGRAIRYNTDYCRDKRYCSLWSLLKTGDLYGADFCYREIPEKLDIFDTQAYRNNPVEFYVTVTDVESGRPLYYRCDKADSRDLELIRASASMPLVSRIVEVDGKKLLDGGVSDSIPLKFFEEKGFNKNIVVLTQPQGYVKKKNQAISVARIMLRKYPKIIEVMKNRHIMYNETTEYIEEKERMGEILVIRPETALPIKRVEKDPDVLWSVYNIGRDAANKRLEEIKAFLN